jgi:hypothetical protein
MNSHRLLSLLIFVVILPIGSFLVARRGSDPIYFLLNFLSQNDTPLIPRNSVFFPFFYFLRILSVWWFCSEAGLAFAIFFSVALIVCKSVNSLIAQLTLKTRAHLHDFIAYHSLRRNMSLYNALRVHMSLCSGPSAHEPLFFSICSESRLFYYQVPLILTTCIGLSGLCNYAILKLHQDLGLSLRLVSPTISMSMLIVANTFLPETQQVYEGSRKYLQTMGELVRSPYDRRVLRSLQPLGVRAAAFFTVKKDTRPTFVRLMVDCTVTLLLY